MSVTELQSGFLVVKTFDRFYRDYVAKFSPEVDGYGFPRKDRPLSEARIQYRGVDRDGLSGYARSEIPAEAYMDVLERSERCSVEGVIRTLEDAREVWSRLDAERKDYEVIWAKVVTKIVPSPAGFHSIGYEPSMFFGDSHFSPSCDSMLFPRWHGTDSGVTVFLEYFGLLNKFGVFDQAKEAERFLVHYLSFDWTERGDFHIVEVFLPD